MALTLNDIVVAAGADPEFSPGMSSNELYYSNRTDERLTDVIATIADAVLDKADASHTHSGYAATSHSHSNYAAASHNHSIANINGLETLLVNAQAEIDAKASADHSHSNYASVSHTHNDYASVTHTHDYADSDHSHSNYAEVNHVHTGYAATEHTHDYADSDHSHTPAAIGAATADHSHSGYAPIAHTHAQTEIDGLVDVLSTKANVSQLFAKADLVDGKVPTSQLPSYVSDVAEYPTRANFPATGEGGKIYVDESTNKTYRWSGSTYVEIAASLALGETSATAYRGDRGKIAYDHSQNGDVHVTAAQKTAWDNKASGSHTHSYNDLSDKPTIPAAYVHPTTHAASMITGLADVATSGSYNDLSNKPTIPTIPASLPANGGNADTVDNKHASDFAAASHSHSYNSLTDKPVIPAAYVHPASHDISMITGLATVATSGSYSDLANVPTALPANGGNADTVDGKHASDFAVANHKHTTHSGDITIEKTNGPGFNLQATNATGVKTRIHKNCNETSDYGTCISDYAADGKRDYLVLRRASPNAANKLLLNVEDANGGAAKMYQIYGEHNKPGVLWSGNLYMGSNHTVTPSKALSDCRTGWMLAWSDYDESTSTTNDADFVFTFIPRLNPAGGVWNGKSTHHDIPRYYGSDTSNPDTEKRIMKILYAYDAKLVGHSINILDTRTDVVLRAVYEF